MRVTQLERLHALLSVEWDAACDRAAPDHYKAIDRTLKILDDITKLFGLDQLGPLVEQRDGDDIRPREMVIGLTEEEYWDALKRVRDKQRALHRVQPAAGEVLSDDEIENAEIVDGTE